MPSIPLDSYPQRASGHCNPRPFSKYAIKPTGRDDGYMVPGEYASSSEEDDEDRVPTYYSRVHEKGCAEFLPVHFRSRCDCSASMRRKGKCNHPLYAHVTLWENTGGKKVRVPYARLLAWALLGASARYQNENDTWVRKVRGHHAEVQEALIEGN